MHTSCREPQVGGGNIGADREDVIEADIGVVRKYSISPL